MDRVVMVASLKSEARGRARELAEQKPRFEDAPGFDRMAVYLSESEVVFVFEGPDVDRSIRAILNDPVSSAGLSPWLPLFDGPLHHASEVYFWERRPSESPRA
jgi:hypothetical protein